LVILGAAAYRYWVSKQHRPTFATSLPEGAPTRSAPTTPASSVPAVVVVRSNEGGMG